MSNFVPPKRAMVLFAAFLSGCLAPTDPKTSPPTPNGQPVGAAPVALADPSTEKPEFLAAAQLRGLKVHSMPGAIELTSARNEWVSCLLQINPPKLPAVLRLPALGEDAIASAKSKAYQVLPVPVDVNRAGFVRHTGLDAAVEALPRALVPIEIKDGAIDLAQLRDPRTPADAKKSGVASGQPLLVWIDLHVPTLAKAGEYASQFALVDPTPPPAPPAGQPAPVVAPLATVPLKLRISDFVLADDRHLTMVGQVPWDSLVQHWPERFEVIRPRLLSRTDANHKDAVRTIDELMSLSQSHRLQIAIDRLQPTVKWPSGQPPRIDWSDYDALIGPWMSGQAFEDQVPLGFLPLPKIDFLDQYLPEPRLEYYTAAASHFDQNDWLRRAPAILDKPTPGRAALAERVTLSAEAQRMVAAHPRLRVMLPLELDELQLADPRNPTLIEPRFTSRLQCVAAGLISSSPLRKWPADMDRPGAWLRTDARGLIPYVGAGGEEADVRVWAWVAFLRNATLIQWDNCLPTTSTLAQSADPNELVWFYPGEWFGTDQIVPTVQLKWLRRAQQDYEYLYLARERGSVLNVLPMARVLAKPVEIQPNQAPDPVYSLLIGTADADAWRRAQALLGRIVMIQGPGAPLDENALAELNLDTLNWIEPLEKPMILPRSTFWSVGIPTPGEVGPWVNLRLGLDLYNASDTTPDRNELNWEAPTRGWLVDPPGKAIPKLSMYQVQAQTMIARIDPNKVSPAKHKPVQVKYRSGFTGRDTPVDFVAPVTRSVRRTAPLHINGSLEDWRDGADEIQDGPLVKMMARPAIQQHQIERSSTPTKIYSGWSENDFYLAFRVEGLTHRAGAIAARNFVDYQLGRAWGEDVCQVVMQAVYEDGGIGPLLHVALKPGGNIWIERKLDPRFNVNPWQNFVAGGRTPRYTATIDADGSVWRGELAIPWSNIIATDKDEDFARQKKPNLPVMLKFNFIQHKRGTGESASWAGPIDIGRDDAFTGVIVLKEPEETATPK